VGVVGHRAGRVLITTWRRYHDGSTRRVLGWARGCGEVRSRSCAFLTEIPTRHTRRVSAWAGCHEQRGVLTANSIACHHPSACITNHLTCPSPAAPALLPLCPHRGGMSP
jgi:hypothetical protein